MLEQQECDARLTSHPHRRANIQPDHIRSGERLGTTIEGCIKAPETYGKYVREGPRREATVLSMSQGNWMKAYGTPRQSFKKRKHFLVPQKRKRDRASEKDWLQKRRKTVQDAADAARNSDAESSSDSSSSRSLLPTHAKELKFQSAKLAKTKNMKPCSLGTCCPRSSRQTS